MENSMPRSCGCPRAGRKMRMYCGAQDGTCSCCTESGAVIPLPVTNVGGAARGNIAAPSTPTMFCADCVHPRGREPRPPAGRSGIKVGMQAVRIDQIPLSLRRLLKSDASPEPNASPSAQRQKRGARHDDNDDEARHWS